MNYNRADLANLYEQVQGKEVPDNKHLQVYGEGTNEDHNIANRNDIGYRDPKTKQWVFDRTSEEFINNIMKPNVEKYGESASYIKKVLAHGKKANVFEPSDTIDNDRVKRVYNYLVAGADRGGIKTIIGEFPRDNLQASLKASLTGGKKFNVYDLINRKLGTKYSYNEDIMYMSPAGEEKKQRGAAGPGEAIFAFLFNGQKPKIGDLDLDGVGVELKKDEGRIGKGINTADIKSMAALFIPRTAAAAKGPGRLNPALDENQRKAILEMNLGDFLKKYSGTGKNPDGFQNTTVGDWFEEHSDQSNYNSIIPLVGALQMKDYFSKVAPFTYLAIYRNEGEMAGFTRDFVETNNIKEIVEALNAKDITFMPNNDGNGYHLKLK